MRPFEYVAPTTIDETIALLKGREAARPIAGGTDIVVQMKESRTKFPYPQTVVSLNRVTELQGIDFDASSGLRLGATTGLTEVAGSAVVREHYAALAEGAGVVGSLQTMNMGTIGGNVCNAAPSADTVPPLLIYDAEAVVVGPKGRRTVALDGFFKGPGQTVLGPDELLAELRLPVPAANTGAVYVRHTPRKQMDIAVVGVGVALTLEGGTITRARVALGAVAPTAIRAKAAEAVLEGQPATDETFARAAEAAAAECSPISDVRGSAEFRRHLVKVWVGRLLAQAAERAK